MKHPYLVAVEFNYIDHDRKAYGFKLGTESYIAFFDGMYKVSPDDLEFLTDVTEIALRNPSVYVALLEILREEQDLMIRGKLYKYMEIGYILRKLLTKEHKDD